MPLACGIYYFFHEGGGTAHPPVILLPGIGGDHLIWTPEIRRLPNLRTYALDLPGHGKSGGVGRQSAEDYARCIVEFMDCVQIWKAVFVTHSMGGALALTLALDHPDRTAGLVLISSGARLPVPSKILENAASPSTFPFAAQELHALSSGTQTPPRVREQNLKRLLALRPTLFYSDLLTCDRFDVTERLASIHVPTLVICGTEDKLTPLHHSSLLAAHIPNAALQTFNEASHMVIQEQPHRLVKTLLVFIQTVPYTPGAK